jgi:polysaccharide deacetylase family protein (PEP-CTERM system associated)
MFRLNVLTIDVEDWFHILDSPASPDLARWSQLPLRLPQNMEILLQLLSDTHTTATFFWLGWMAERFPQLVRQCREEGHEIASHGYGHILAYKVGRDRFREDIQKTKTILEDLAGCPVKGFRAPGFGVTKNVPWAFDVIKKVGYEYDSSVFPASRGHGGMSTSPIGPYFIHTEYGMLPEIPMSVVNVFGRKLSLFGGGYLRLATKSMIRWGIRKLRETNQPLVVYIHPREVDPNHPRLPLSAVRKFKCYVNLKTTMPKLRWLCNTYPFCSMLDMVERYFKLFYLNRNIPIPTIELKGNINTFGFNGR